MRVPRSICQGPTNTSEVLTLAFSPDGMTLASAGRVNVKLWDIASGKFLLDVDAGNYVTALAFSPEGRQLAVGRYRGFGDPDNVNVWDLETWAGIDSLRGLSRSIFWATFSPDGRLVAVLSSDWHVGIWDRAAHRLLHVLEVTPGTHIDNAALAFSPDGRRFAFSAGHEASLWDVVSGDLIKTWKLFEGLGDRLAFPEPNRLLLFRVETETGELGPFGTVDPIKHPRVCRVRELFGAEPLKPVAEIRDFNLHVFTSECSPDGKYYAIEGKKRLAWQCDTLAILYEGPTGSKLRTLPTQNTISFPYASFNFDSTGTVLYYFYKQDEERQIVSARNPVPSRPAPIRSHPAMRQPPCGAVDNGFGPHGRSSGGIDPLQRGPPRPLDQLRARPRKCRETPVQPGWFAHRLGQPRRCRDRR